MKYSLLVTEVESSGDPIIITKFKSTQNLHKLKTLGMKELPRYIWMKTLTAAIESRKVDHLSYFNSHLDSIDKKNQARIIINPFLT